MIDSHTHCIHSHDGRETPESMIEAALERGLAYIALTDHFDRDLLGIPEYERFRQLDLPLHFRQLYELREKYAGKIVVGVGVECGWSSRAEGGYAAVLAPYSCDIVVNSVHMIQDEDCYLPAYFRGRAKAQAYGLYLEAVRASLDAPYAYDTVAHIGYAARKAPYEDPVLRYEEFSEQLDDILRTIIGKGKCLEINTHCGKIGCDFLPDRATIRRYRELGGELITFGSDAHVTARIADRYECVAEFLRETGFRYLFGYVDGHPLPFRL